jgi:TPR repeat protein
VAALEPRPVPPLRSNEEVDDLIGHGDEFLATGDIIAARAFYLQAAEQGSAAAAADVGRTFDPIFLDQNHARGIHGDAVAAMSWYRKALDGGERSVDVPLRRLMARFPG